MKDKGSTKNENKYSFLFYLSSTPIELANNTICNEICNEK